MISKITVEKKLLELGVLEPSDSAEEIIAMTKVLVMILPLAEGDMQDFLLAAALSSLFESGFKLGKER